MSHGVAAGGLPYAWPLCECCGEAVDQHGLGTYPINGKPRRFCSSLCHQTRSSRVSAPIRAATPATNPPARPCTP